MNRLPVICFGVAIAMVIAAIMVIQLDALASHPKYEPTFIALAIGFIAAGLGLKED